MISGQLLIALTAKLRAVADVSFASKTLSRRINNSRLKLHGGTGGAAHTSAGRRAVLAAKRQLSLMQRAISDSIKTLERDGVLAEQAGHPLNAFATDGLGLYGKRIGREQLSTYWMSYLQQLITTVF